MAQEATNLPPLHGIARLAARGPRWLYRLGLGWLLGERFLMLTHIGRKSGLPRQVVLEVVRHDVATDTYLIASGWGKRADWLRNIDQNPHVLLHTGTRRVEATASRLPIELAADEFCEYARRHPLAARNLSKLMTGAALERTAESCRRLAERVPLVALHVRQEGTA
jgi:deazaflavin-dependent oxidoreductase (nitroreductase family)